MKRSFFFHYNKPASRAAGENRLTVHWKGQCLIVRSLSCHVGIETRARKTQPRCVMAGKAESVTVDENMHCIIR